MNRPAKPAPPAMTKALAVEAALKDVSPLTEGPPCQWSFTFKDQFGVPFRSGPKPYGEAVARRRAILINKARRAMGRDEIDTSECTGKKWEYFV